MSELLYGSCVSLKEGAVLLLGPSGSGKSDLALRLIDEGAKLVADDLVAIELENGVLYASPAPNIAGLIEARGVGILKLPHLERQPVAAAIQLVSRPEVERLPEPAFFDCLGAMLPLLLLHGFDGSACLKIRHYLSIIKEPSL